MTPLALPTSCEMCIVSTGQGSSECLWHELSECRGQVFATYPAAKWKRLLETAIQLYRIPINDPFDPLPVRAANIDVFKLLGSACEE